VIRPLAGPGADLLVLLVAGHFLADFLFQTRRTVEAKRLGFGYLRHGVVVFLVQLLAALPFVSPAFLVVLAGIAAAHVLVDRGKTSMSRRRPGSLTVFFVDQGIHLAVVVAGWWILLRIDGATSSLALSVRMVRDWVSVVVLAAAFSFNATGGSAIVEGVLEHLPLSGREPAAGSESPESPRLDTGYPGAGRLIGMLERTLMLVLVLFGQWAAAVLLLTAKSIARFEELKVRRFAEYYLVGTLTSLLVATAVGLVLGKALGGL